MILAAEAHCRSLSLSLEFVSATEFLAINRANRATWLPLASIYNPELSKIAPNEAMFIVGRDEAGTAVACQACRFFFWPDTSFAEECESLRLWYRDPETQRNPGERSIVTARAAHGTFGRVAYSGAAWYHPKWRGKGLSACLPRLSRALARGLWDADTAVTLMSESVIKQGVYPRTGYRNIEWSVEVINNQSGNIRFAYIWTKAGELEDELETYLSGQPQAAIAVGERRIG
jgi:hypothetical protein